MPIDEARRQKNRPPGFSTRHISPSIASNCASSRAKCITALLSTTSNDASANVMCSIGSARMFSAGRAGASDSTTLRTAATASGSASTAETS